MEGKVFFSSLIQDAELNKLVIEFFSKVIASYDGTYSLDQEYFDKWDSLTGEVVELVLDGNDKAEFICNAIEFGTIEETDFWGARFSMMNKTNKTFNQNLSEERQVNVEALFLIRDLWVNWSQEMQELINDSGLIYEQECF